MNVLVGIFRFQEQHLRDDQIGRVVVDRTDQKYNTLLEKPRINVIRALSTPALFNDHWHEPECPCVVHQCCPSKNGRRRPRAAASGPVKMGPRSADVKDRECNWRKDSINLLGAL